MCDTPVRVEPGRVMLAENPDRDEAQLVEWHPAAEHARDAMVRCTHRQIPQVRRTHAVLIPRRMWGAEMGTDEHGVTIGNEAVFADQPCARTGLTGMDLLRLALERASTASRAVEVVTCLLELHGQGGRRHLATVTAVPCTCLLEAVAVDRPLDLGPDPTDRHEPSTPWWRHERPHRTALRDPAVPMARFAPERDEADPATAFAGADGFTARWTAEVQATAPRDRRPLHVRRCWKRRDRRAGMPSAATPAGAAR